MLATDSHISRRGAYVFIALFSCLQILFGFFLITGNEAQSPAPIIISAHETNKEILHAPQTLPKQFAALKGITPISLMPPAQ